MQRSSRTLACFSLLLFANFDSEAAAAPALQPKTAYEICLQKRSNCEFSAKRAFANCFSDSGEVSPAQYYCLRLEFDQMMLNYQEGLDFVAIEKSVSACVAEHHQDLEPDAPLDLSNERYKMCTYIANFEFDSCLNENDCSKLAPAPSNQSRNQDGPSPLESRD